jgi:hypothetical protein
MSDDRGERTIIWAFATFHAALFVLVIVLVAYRGGGLGPALQELNTAVGLGLFVALWATTFVTTGKALRGLGLGAPARIDDLAFTAAAIRWGAINGVMFLGILAVVFLGGSAATHFDDLLQALRGPTVVQSAAFLVGGLIVASAVAMIAGGLIGLIFAGIDLFLLGIAARATRQPRSSPSASGRGKDRPFR